MKKIFAVLLVMFLVASCTTKKEETKKMTESNTKVETSTGKVQEETKKEEETKTSTGETTQEEIKKEEKTKTSEKNPDLVDGLEFVFIVDKNEKISQELKVVENMKNQIANTPDFKGVKLIVLDFNNDEAKRILKENEIKELPVLLTNKNKWFKSKPANTQLKALKGGLFLLQPGFYNYETKKYTIEIGSLCSNGKDDDGNGKKDCEDSLCLQTNPNNVCEKELKKLQEEYLKKQAEAQAKLFEKIKSDKPNVDLYVMSYCPFGTQAEKPFTSIMKKFGKVANVDIKFVQYVMHTSQGEGEENLKQYCIKTTQKDKFVDYLTCFLKEGKSDECMKETKIDKTKVDNCIKETDKKFNITKKLADKSKRFPDFDIDKETAKKAGVQGSPTLVINGLKIDQVKRTERGFAEVICKAFKKAPAICSDLSKFSDKSYKPGFGFEDSTNGATQAAGCAAQ